MKKGRLLLVLYGTVLMLLFLASSTDWIIKEKKIEIYPISVIIQDTNDSRYVNFRKGMDQAAIELNADVSFVTLYEENSQAQQKEFMRREILDGSQALVVAPVDGEELWSGAGEWPVPVVLTGCGVSQEKAAAVVGADDRQMGGMLGARIAAKAGPQDQVLLLCGKTASEMDRQFEAGLTETLNQEGILLRRVQKKGNQTFSDAVEAAVGRKKGKVYLAAVDQGSLESAASLLGERQDLHQAVEGLYGRGSSVSVLTGVDRGLIQGICADDEFGRGYLCVKRAVEAASGRLKEKKTVLESFYLEKGDLREKRFEKLLYPIE